MTASQLDKSYTRDLEELGTMNVRVVVLPRKVKDGPLVKPLDGEDDFALAIGKSPIDSYLERSDSRGKMCVVFQLNGQRQDFLEHSFISRELEFRYLRNRTLILVELDGLTQRAMDQLIKGDRVGFYRGDVFNIIRKRLADTLRRDPDLEALELEAEEQVAELDSGTDAIRKKLDQMIQEHDLRTERDKEPPLDLPVGPGGQRVLTFGESKAQSVVVEGGAKTVDGPYLAGSGPATIRLRPDGGARSFEVHAEPAEAWSKLQAIEARLARPLAELGIAVEDIPSGKRITVRFEEGQDSDDDQYPIEATLQVVAKFDGHEEIRLLERAIEVGKPKKREPRKPPELLAEPSLLRVVTKQPIALVPGGDTAHVRVKWNGKDELVAGRRPTWTISARCTTLLSFPKVTHTKPQAGRFELLIDTPRTLLAAQDLEFEVEARGPNDRVLHATFKGRLEQPTETEEVGHGVRKRKTPELQTHYPRPYEFKLIGEGQWEDNPYWSKPNWNAQSVACFMAPTKKDPLVLVLNKDFEGLHKARDEMVAKGLQEATIEERVTKYYTHIALHLYAMYKEKLAQDNAEASAGEEGSSETIETYMEGEIERVAQTILRLLP